ncbi:glycosyltransferase [Kribbella sp. NPDC004536]|uniref:glycosyltransferase n=1 Tax=Kribbella sp. NPDC004536 TaxID=3364106 RepID=UPI003685ED28
MGLPVYNGQRYLGEALDSLLAQSFTDFELIISDNASTDGTEEICRRYADQDPRIRYIRQPRNIGATPNHNFVVDEARGEYFKFAAHDDLYGRDLLARCVEALDAHPDVVLSHADMAIIDETGTIVRNYDYTLATGSADPKERFRGLVVTDGADDEYGVIRTQVVRSIRRKDSYHHGARPWIAELAFRGRFHQVPELLYFRRDHPERGDRRATIPALCTNLDPRRAGQSTARLLAEYGYRYLEAIARAPLSRGDRLACYRILVSHLARSGFHRVIKRNTDPLFVAGGPKTPGDATINAARGATTS